MNLLSRETTFVIFNNGGLVLARVCKQYLEWYYDWVVQNGERLSTFIVKLCGLNRTSNNTIRKLVRLAGVRWNWSSILFDNSLFLPTLLTIVDEIGGWDPAADGQFALRDVMTNGILFADDRPFKALVRRADVDPSQGRDLLEIIRSNQFTIMTPCGTLKTVSVSQTRIRVLLEPVWIGSTPYYESVNDSSRRDTLLGYMTERSSALSLAFYTEWLGETLDLALHPRVPNNMCQRYFDAVWIPFTQTYISMSVNERKVKALARGIVLPDF